MKPSLHFVAFAMLSAAAAGAAFAQLPKEGTYDFTACWSGVSSPIAFSKNLTASSFEMTGSIRSNTPGGMFDKEAFRCVGMNYSFESRSGATTVCEAVDRDGDKRLTFFATTGENVDREAIAGTGKYEGLVTSGSIQPLGPFPTIKAGTFQNCHLQRGTYKIK